MCCTNCRDTIDPKEVPSRTSTVWVRIGGMVSGRPAIAAMPTAIMAPEIKPPGRFAHRNNAPPAVPMTSVSSTLSVLAREGTANAVETGIRLTMPYGKSAAGGQMRQRDAAMHIPARFSARLLLCPHARRYSPASSGSCDSRDAGLPPTRRRVVQALGLRLRRGAFGGALAFRHEFLALLAMDALGVGFL